MFNAGKLPGDIRSEVSGEQVLYERELTLIHDMSDARRLRLLQAREGIPDLLWIVLGLLLLAGHRPAFAADELRVARAVLLIDAHHALGHRQAEPRRLAVLELDEHAVRLHHLAPVFCSPAGCNNAEGLFELRCRRAVPERQIPGTAQRDESCVCLE